MSVSNKIIFEIRKKQEEDEKEVAHVIKKLKEEGYPKERLERLLAKAKGYEKQGLPGQRANKNVIKAVELLLSPGSSCPLFESPAN